MAATRSVGHGEDVVGQARRGRPVCRDRASPCRARPSRRRRCPRSSRGRLPRGSAAVRWRAHRRRQPTRWPTPARAGRPSRCSVSGRRRRSVPDSARDSKTAPGPAVGARPPTASGVHVATTPSRRNATICSGSNTDACAGSSAASTSKRGRFRCHTSGNPTRDRAATHWLRATRHHDRDLRRRRPSRRRCRGGVDRACGGRSRTPSGKAPRHAAGEQARAGLRRKERLLVVADRHRRVGGRERRGVFG